MSLWRRGKRYFADFTIGGLRYRPALGTNKLAEARRKEREFIKAAESGSLTAARISPKRLSKAIDYYVERKSMKWSPRTLELTQERASIVKRYFNDVPLKALTPDAIARFQRARRKAGISNRTINMDVSLLTRILKVCECWRPLEGRVDMLPENQAIIGRALTFEEQERLYKAAASNPEWEHVYLAAIVAANTTLRPIEVKNLRRRDVDTLDKLQITIRRSKNESSHRVIPLNGSALKALARMIERADSLGFTDEAHFLWFACQWERFDPTKPIRKWDTAWRALREKAALPGLRFHDLRHTVITELAEMGVPDSVPKSIAGHLSQRMLEHYSHIRLKAKRQALDNLDDFRNQQRQLTKSNEGTESTQ